MQQAENKTSFALVEGRAKALFPTKESFTEMVLTMKEMDLPETKVEEFLDLWSEGKKYSIGVKEYAMLISKGYSKTEIIHFVDELSIIAQQVALPFDSAVELWVIAHSDRKIFASILQSVIDNWGKMDPELAFTEDADELFQDEEIIFSEERPWLSTQVLCEEKYEKFWKESISKINEKMKTVSIMDLVMSLKEKEEVSTPEDLEIDPMNENEPEEVFDEEYESIVSENTSGDYQDPEDELLDDTDD